MSRRFWTADFHLGMDAIVKWENRPFKDVSQMNAAYLRSCAERAGPEDVVIHLGDLACVGPDRHGGLVSEGLDFKASALLANVSAQFVNVRGNHDTSNRTFSVCESMRTSLGRKYPDVSASHYPSYDMRGALHWLNGDIHLCGHVHGKWKHCLDVTNRVLNINVGVDAWGHMIVSEEEIIAYLGRLFRLPSDKLFQCRVRPQGQVEFFGDVKAGESK